MTDVDPARVAQLLERASDVRVLVIGDLMLDQYVFGRVERVSPEAPVPVVLVEGRHSALGGAGNVAANVTALGAGCAIVGCTGDDPESEVLVSALEDRGVEAGGVVRAASRPTTVKTRVHAKNQQIVRFDRELERDVEEDVAAALIEAIRTLAQSSDALVVQDYNKGVLTREVIEAVLVCAEETGQPLIVDPKRRSFFDYRGATVFKPNKRELEDALGEVVRPDDDDWMEATRRRIGCRHLLVTLGDQGMALKTAGADLLRLPAVTQEVYDVSGAGDTVSATMAVTLAAGGSVVEAAIVANHAAAIEVRRPGVQTVSAREIEAQVRTGARRSQRTRVEDP